eukprot:6383725-Amphidinium_carterae.2
MEDTLTPFLLSLDLILMLRHYVKRGRDMKQRSLRHFFTHSHNREGKRYVAEYQLKAFGLSKVS